MKGHDRVAWLAVLGLCLGPEASCSSSESCMCLDCKTISTTPVAWTDQTEVGTPEAMFSQFAGTCQAPFHWDASSWGTTITVEPVQGQSTITATVILDQSSARWLSRSQCPNQLQANGMVTLILPEGTVANQQAVTISAEGGSVPTSLGFSLKEEEFGPWVSIRKSDPASTLSMTITISAQACSGEIRLNSASAPTRHGNETSMTGANGPLATWSTGSLP